jgi:hypothetical protein
MLLNTDLAEVFDKPDGAEGLLAMVKGLSDKYKSLNDTYIAQGKTVIKLINDTVVPYVAFFMKVFADVKKHMTDQLNFITNRKGNMGYSYDFNDSIKASIFKTYEEIKMVLDNLGITNEIPLLNILSIINTLKTKIFDPNKGFPLKPIFDDYILNGKKFLLPGTRDNYDSYNKTEIVVTLTSKYIDATVPEDFVTKYVLSNDTTTTGKVSFGFKPNELDIDILFYLLYRATNNVIYAIMKEQKEFEKIDENKNDELRKRRQDVDLNEKKLKQVCELIANISSIRIERLIPDRAKYIKKDGFIDPDKYEKSWKDKMDEPGSGSGTVKIDVTFAISKMKKRVYQTLGIDMDVKNREKNQKTLDTLLSTLIEHNTVQVINMLFAKPRQIL